MALPILSLPIPLLLALYLHPPALTALPAFSESLPPASDLERFPSYEMCDRQLAFLAARRAWLDTRRELYSDPIYVPWFEDAVEDCQARRRPWEALHEAQSWSRPEPAPDEWDERRGCPPEYCRRRGREALAELRSLLGPREYAAGRLPGLVGAAFQWRTD